MSHFDRNQLLLTVHCLSYEIESNALEISKARTNRRPEEVLPLGAMTRITRMTANEKVTPSLDQP